MSNTAATLESSLAVSENLNIELDLSSYPTLKVRAQEKWKPMSTQKVVHRCSQPESSNNTNAHQFDEWINKMWSSHKTDVTWACGGMNY